MGATRLLLDRTDADYLEMEALLMAFVDDVRAHCTATAPLQRLHQLVAAAQRHVRLRRRARDRLRDRLAVRLGAHLVRPQGDLTVDDVAAMYADFAAGMVRAPMRVD